MYIWVIEAFSRTLNWCLPLKPAVDLRRSVVDELTCVPWPSVPWLCYCMYICICIMHTEVLTTKVVFSNFAATLLTTVSCVVCHVIKTSYFSDWAVIIQLQHLCSISAWLCIFTQLQLFFQAGCADLMHAWSLWSPCRRGIAATWPSPLCLTQFMKRKIIIECEE